MTGDTHRRVECSRCARHFKTWPGREYSDGKTFVCLGCRRQGVAADSQAREIERYRYQAGRMEKGR